MICKDECDSMKNARMDNGQSAADPLRKERQVQRLPEVNHGGWAKRREKDRAEQAPYYHHLHWDLGMTTGEIAAEEGCTPENIQWKFRRLGIKARSGKDMYSLRSEKQIGAALPILNDKESMRKLYEDEMLSVNSIAIKIGCSAGVVMRTLIRHDIPRRNLSVLDVLLARGDSRAIVSWLKTSTTPSHARLIVALEQQGLYIPISYINFRIGHYFIDIAFPEAMLAIEIDGGVHTWKKIQEKDAKKQAFCESKGWKVIRFTNEQADGDTDKVVESILNEIVGRIWHEHRAP